MVFLSPTSHPAPRYPALLHSPFPLLRSCVPRCGVTRRGKGRCRMVGSAVWLCGVACCVACVPKRSWVGGGEWSSSGPSRVSDRAEGRWRDQRRPSVRSGGMAYCTGDMSWTWQTHSGQSPPPPLHFQALLPPQSLKYVRIQRGTFRQVASGHHLLRKLKKQGWPPWN